MDSTFGTIWTKIVDSILDTKIVDKKTVDSIIGTKIVDKKTVDSIIGTKIVDNNSTYTQFLVQKL